jgi:hypothetical protein
MGKNLLSFSHGKKNDETGSPSPSSRNDQRLLMSQVATKKDNLMDTEGTPSYARTVKTEGFYSRNYVWVVFNEGTGISAHETVEEAVNAAHQFVADNADHAVFVYVVFTPVMIASE